MKSTLERFIKQIIKDNVKTNEYLPTFGEEMQEQIKEKSDIIAKITLEDEELIKAINDSIEESIRIMVLRDK